MTQVTCGGKLNHFLGRYGHYLLHTLIVTVILMLRFIDHGKGTKPFNGYTWIFCLAQTEAYLIKHVRQECLDC